MVLSCTILVGNSEPAQAGDSFHWESKRGFTSDDGCTTTRSTEAYTCTWPCSRTLEDRSPADSSKAEKLTALPIVSVMSRPDTRQVHVRALFGLNKLYGRGREAIADGFHFNR